MTTILRALRAAADMIEIARMLERFAREAREDVRLGGDE